ncbi:MAG: dockerin type I domain-containing protein, partial [Planctomycetota bacterium]
MALGWLAIGQAVPVDAAEQAPADRGIIAGDIDGDGRVGAADLGAFNRMLRDPGAYLDERPHLTTEHCLELADLDRDGRIGRADWALLRDGLEARGDWPPPRDPWQSLVTAWPQTSIASPSAV